MMRHTDPTWDSCVHLLLGMMIFKKVLKGVRRTLVQEMVGEQCSAPFRFQLEIIFEGEEVHLHLDHEMPVAILATRLLQGLKL